MTALEIYITITQTLQKINSFRDRSYLQEEIEFNYNHIRDQFINQKIKRNQNGYYEFDEAWTDSLQTLKVINKELKAFINIDRSQTTSLLPPDYLYLVNDRTIVNSNCKSTQAIIQTTQNITEYVSVLSFTNSTAISSFYDVFTITIGGTIRFNIDNYKTGGFESIEQKYEVANLAIEELNRAGYIVYWEKYRDLYYKDSFIIVAYSTFTSAINVDSITASGILTSTVYKIANNTSTTEVSNRLTRSEVIFDMQRNSFSKTSKESPLSMLSNNSLICYFDNKFIINKTFIDYIRKPRKFSIILNRNCELPEFVQRQICDLTVEYIKLSTGSNQFQAKQEYNTINIKN